MGKPDELLGSVGHHLPSHRLTTALLSSVYFLRISIPAQAQSKQNAKLSQSGVIQYSSKKARNLRANVSWLLRTVRLKENLTKNPNVPLIDGQLLDRGIAGIRV